MIFHRLLSSGKAEQPFRPRITFPLNNEELFEFDFIEGSSFLDSGGSGVHRGSRWQLSTNADFTSVAADTGVSLLHLTEIPISEFDADMLSAYYVRVRYYTLTEESTWSDPVAFSTNLFEQPILDWADSIFDALLFGF